MPIGPSGGGPVGSSNSFTGAAQTLEFMGNGHWGAWSGEQDLTATTDITLFEFLSPSKNLKAVFGFAANLTVTGANDIQMQISFDDAVVFNLYETAAVDRGGNFGAFPDPLMIIPSETNVKVIMRSDEAGVTPTGTAWITAEEL